MKVNNVYAAEIAKMEGDKATKPFRVLWEIGRASCRERV